MTGAHAVVHGAVSLVNAIATQKGATVGIDLKAEATIHVESGQSNNNDNDKIDIHSKNPTSSRLILETISKVIPKKIINENKITVDIDSNIPAGYGLKSSSAVSSAVALACARIFKPNLTDRQILLAGVNASIDTKVSITGAYDDACSCYYGGFNITNNAKRMRVRFANAPTDMIAIIHIPKNRKRGNIKNLKILSSIFECAWNMAKNEQYWDAMTVNGLAVSEILGYNSGIIAELVQNGAIGASMSGNGPAIAAVAQKNNESDIKNVFAEIDGTTITSKISNTKAHVYDL